MYLSAFYSYAANFLTLIYIRREIINVLGDAPKNGMARGIILGELVRKLYLSNTLSFSLLSLSLSLSLALILDATARPTLTVLVCLFSSISPKSCFFSLLCFKFQKV
jgi:hypothetical protein